MLRNCRKAKCGSRAGAGSIDDAHRGPKRVVHRIHVGGCAGGQAGPTADRGVVTGDVNETVSPSNRPGAAVGRSRPAERHGGVVRVAALVHFAEHWAGN